MGENHEDDADDYGACFHKAFIFLAAFFVQSARALGDPFVQQTV